MFKYIYYKTCLSKSLSLLLMQRDLSRHKEVTGRKNPKCKS